MSATVLAFKDGGGDGPCDPKDITIYILEKQNEELRALMRRLLDSDGPEAIDAMAAAEKELASEHNADREEWYDRWRENGCQEELSLERIAAWTDTECYDSKIDLREHLGRA
jgi:hypothetical protein